MLKIFLIYFASKTAFARDVCFEFELVSENSSVTAALIQNANYLTVNGYQILFSTYESRTESGVVVYTRNRGCMNNTYIFDRPNDMKFSIQTLSGDVIPARLTIYLYVVVPNGGRKWLFTHIWEKGTRSTNANFSGSFTLEQLDPEKAEQIKKQKEAQKAKEEKDKLERKLKDENEQAKKYRIKIEKGHEEKMAKARKESDELRDKVEKKKNNNKQSSNEISQGLDNALAILEDLDLSEDDGIQESPLEAFCFPAGTTVRTLDGGENIETLKTGDLVIANDFEQAMCVMAHVDEIYTHKVNTLQEITLEEGVIRATPNHPFYSLGRACPSVRK